ncbi:28S ribosomal protein S30, mitochondrial [Drosophila subobscura]|uniref:28S ribosomal protein S30, mitochondrial n=1 Tax=Drosophila subobscura TaxID=7241 RepID=UPI00155A3FBC|nr:28S ribosomal protein S30, mitochondrial [Drosophila subobscura]
MLKLSRVNQLRASSLRFLAAQPQAQAEAASGSGTSNENSPEPEYPPIRDLTYKAVKRREAGDWHEEIRKVPTVEEKLIKVNMPRYYGYKVVDFNDNKIPYNALPVTQHYTRTVLQELPLPTTDEGQKSESSLDSFLQAARNDVIDALELAHDFYNHQATLPDFVPSDSVTRERQLTQVIVEQVNRALQQVLSADYPHLNDVEVDYNPRHEAFWAVGGVDAPKNVQNSKKGRDWQKDDASDSVDRLVQYTGSPYLALRHRQQLCPWMTEKESENIELARQLPRFKHDARTLGYRTTYQHAVNVPGYWPSANGPNFGLLSFQSRASLQTRHKAYGDSDFQEALNALAIKSSYAWLLAQATYNGFNTYNDLTYPMNTQTVITNGREWSFYEYQLNTLLLHGNQVDENPRVNSCRGTPPLPLYAEISEKGKCVDFNDATLKQLLRVYTNVPKVERAANELHPYVTARTTDYDNAQQRDFIEKTFKHLSSKRPRHLELPEIYLWEKLYKIDHKTRAMEAKRRFFELDINPWRRTLEKHDKEYVPRAVRPGGRKNREDRFKKTFYP